MSERLTPCEIEQLRIWQASGADTLHYRAQKAVRYMLDLHDLMERLRRLQPDDVTNQQRVDWLHSPWSGSDLKTLHHEMIAAAVRVMVASLDKPADSA